MRQYTKTIETQHGTETVLRKGIVLVHLFNDVWRIGKAKNVNNRLHSVIYAPDGAEYHVWGKDVENFYSPKYEDYYNRPHTRPDPAKVKIYILTSILDKRENWCFDMKLTPKLGERVKVVFENGTIKYIDSFSGDWNNHKLEIHENIPTRLNPEWEEYHYKIKKDGEEIPSQFIWKPYIKYKNIVAWRIK